MIPAKNRDRKCSTCRHYQPSPLWRKGWCRNPLLYDRNTNHLVEADSLACNRTFIDYWEPVTGPTQPVGPSARSPRPRIAPSIPVETMDAQGRRAVTTGNTPAGGVAAYVPETDAPLTDAYMGGNRDVPKLAIVTPDYQPEVEEKPEDARRPHTPSSKVTRQIPQIAGPEALAPLEEDQFAKTAAQRIEAARRAARPSFLSTMTGRIVLAALVLLLVAAGGAGFLIMKNRANTAAPIVMPTALPTQPPPTPTGFGDATATPVPTNTPVLPPAGTIGVNGWVQTTASLNVRDNPSTAGKRVIVLSPGTKAHVIDGPKSANGLTWWKIDRFDPKNPAATGWCAGSFLKATTAP